MTDQISAPVLLYAEDEPVIRFNTLTVLKDAGFEVIVARNGEEALHLLAAEHGRIDGLVTDIDLGHGATGWNVAHRARMLIARIPVLYASSASEFDWMTHGVPLSRLLAKPYRASKIVEMILALLNPLPGPDDKAGDRAQDGQPGLLGDIGSTLRARRAAIARVAQSAAARRTALLAWG